jgi:hypothetical protein
MFFSPTGIATLRCDIHGTGFCKWLKNYHIAKFPSRTDKFYFSVQKKDKWLMEAFWGESPAGKRRFPDEICTIKSSLAPVCYRKKWTLRVTTTKREFAGFL